VKEIRKKDIKEKIHMVIILLKKKSIERKIIKNIKNTVDKRKKRIKVNRKIILRELRKLKKKKQIRK
jgi:hypothetical protein